MAAASWGPFSFAARNALVAATGLHGQLFGGFGPAEIAGWQDRTQESAPVASAVARHATRNMGRDMGPGKIDRLDRRPGAAAYRPQLDRPIFSISIIVGALWAAILAPGPAK